MNRISVNELCLNSKPALRDVELQFCLEKIGNEKIISVDTSTWSSCDQRKEKIKKKI